MPMVFDNALMMHPHYERPGYAFIIGGGIPKGKTMKLEDAELYKDRYEEKKLLPKYPPPRPHRCHISGSKMRCSACRLSYCSKDCQRRDWYSHLFLCRIRGRLNPADNFIWLIKNYLRPLPGATHFDSADFRKHLYLDNDLCMMFGFNQCRIMAEFQNLTCLYRELIFESSITSLQLQFLADNGLLENQFHGLIAQRRNSTCHCHTWFEQATAEGDFKFQLHDSSTRFAHLDEGLYRAFEEFSDLPEPDESSRAVFGLYSLLYRDFDNLPDESHAAWINFGFCYYRSDEMKMKMAAAYKKLAKVANFQDILQAWEKIQAQ
jgi:hypothetical protein